jgi:hypothetical protein
VGVSSSSLLTLNHIEKNTFSNILSYFVSYKRRKDGKDGKEKMVMWDIKGVFEEDESLSR